MKTMFRLFSMVMSFVMLFGAVLPCSVSAEISEADFYRSRFIDLIGFDATNDESSYVFYNETFRYYSDSASIEEATPDYVMAIAFFNPVPDILVHSYFGEYVISTGPYSPYRHGYHIYVPAEDKVYTLEDAYNSGVSGIEEALKSLSAQIAIVGDCDANHKINVKDATYLQKHIAELDVPSHSFWEPELVFDYNKDKNVNIRDATAIQKHIAGLPY